LLIENDIDFAIKNKKGLIAEEIDPIENINDIAGYEVNNYNLNKISNELNLNMSNSGETKYKSSSKTKNEKNNQKNMNSSDIKNFNNDFNDTDDINDFQTIQKDFINQNNENNNQDLIELSKEINLSIINQELNNDNNNNPKEEKIINVENKSLYDFLLQINMQKYYDKFNSNGFEDINIIIEDTKLGNNLTDNQLKLIGISNPGDRAKILIRFEEKSNLFDFIVPKSVYYYLNNFDKIENDLNIIKLNNWLKNIKLEEYLIKFINNGYYSLDLLFMQSLSKNPLNDEILKDEFRIDKLGHRARIINKLKEENKNYYKNLRESIVNFYKEENTKICSECSIF